MRSRDHVWSFYVDMADEVKHIQALFSSKDARLKVSDSPFSIPVSATRQDLSSLIAHLLQGPESDENVAERELDFLIRGDFLQGSLDNHIAKKSISTETVIEIEVIERNPPPQLNDEFDHKDWVSALHINNQFILTGCYNNTVNIWNHDGQQLCTADDHASPVKDVVWISSNSESDDGLLFASASQDQNIHIYSFSASDSQITHLHTCKGHARSVECLAVNSGHDKFCSVSWDKLLKIWSAIPDKQVVDEIEKEDQLTTKRFKTDSNQRRATTRTPLLTLQAHTQPILTVIWPLEDEVLSAGMEHCIRLWDIPSGVNKSTLTGSKVFHCIHRSELNGLVASANSDKVVRIWDTRIGENSMVQTALTSHQGWVIAVRWSPIREHQLLSGSYDSSLKVWDIRSSKLPLFTITAHEGKVLCLDWSLPQLLASGGTDNNLRTFSFGNLHSNHKISRHI